MDGVLQMFTFSFTFNCARTWHSNVIHTTTSNLNTSSDLVLLQYDLITRLDPGLSYCACMSRAPHQCESDFEMYHFACLHYNKLRVRCLDFLSARVVAVSSKTKIGSQLGSCSAVFTWSILNLLTSHDIENRFQLEGSILAWLWQNWRDLTTNAREKWECKY